MSRTTSRIVSALAVTALLAGGVAACGNDSESEAEATATAKIETEPLPEEASFEGDWEGAKADVTLEECELTEGSQTAKGVVTNSSDDTRDYQIIVMWMNDDDGTPYASGVSIVNDLKSGAEESFEVTVDVPIDVDKCVLNVKAGEITE